MEPTSEMSLFLSALDKETLAEREAFLDAACAGQPALRAQVANLLAAHERSGLMLDRTPSALGALWSRLKSTGDATASGNVAGPVLPSQEGSGTVIGPYRLMEQIGEGGFGLVFVAEQQQPIRRKVALKLIKPGMDTREVIARFEAERQALALMDHPHIARVFDAGATQSGRPYFVMELVRGIPITEFCDQAQLSIRDRLELFIDVCLAIQHAHQKGVIHRDVKPSNVLVTLHDGVPVAKVIDFGVAKAIGPDLTERTIYTRFAQMIGTPLYMSPEQAELNGLDVDTRSDIYSLGVVLYVLLAGDTPFDSRRLQAASFDELRKIICQEPPPRPSIRTTTFGERLATVSAQRQIDPAKLSTALRGDLDRIVMKALEKDRTQRYQTAAALADDVRRYLNAEPVLARPPSAAYRFSLFARRHKLVLTAAALVLTAMIAGTAVSAWQAVRATRAQAEAERLRKEAVEFVDRLKEANILLDSARAYADERNWALADAEYQRAGELQPDHALIWSGRGLLHARLGLWHEAARNYARALALGASPNNPNWWGTAQLFAYTGDVENYRRVCSMAAQHLETLNDPFTAWHSLRACLVSPASTVDPEDVLRRFVELERRFPPPRFGPPGGERRPEFPPRELGPPPPPHDDRRPQPLGPPMLMLNGSYLPALVNLRARRFEEVQTRLRWLVDAPERERLLGATTYPVLALARHHQGHEAEAREALEQSRSTLDAWLKLQIENPLAGLPLPWPDWLEFLCLHREATETVTGQPWSVDPRLSILEQRAQKALQPAAR